jgi:hypothetical protein
MGPPIVMDEAVKQRVDALWDEVVTRGGRWGEIIETGGGAGQQRQGFVQVRLQGRDAQLPQLRRAFRGAHHTRGRDAGRQAGQGHAPADIAAAHD